MKIDYLALCQNIKLSDVESLTFYKDKFTTSRHMNSVPQVNIKFKMIIKNK